MDWYPWVKLVHILAAITAVGTNLTYFVWLRWVRERSERSAFILTSLQALDRRMANPGYIVLPISGVIMVLISPDLEFSTFWIATAIALFLATAAVAGILFSPAVRRQVEIAQGGEGDYAAAAQRTMLTGTITMVLVAAIVVLMVVKPR